MPAVTGIPFFLLVFVVGLTYLPSSFCVRCYACTSSLPPESSESGKNSAKIVISGLYTVPEVSTLCNNPKDLEFVNVLKVDCESKNDVCVKVAVSVQELQFTIRGCKNSVFKRFNTPPSPCDSTQSPSVCECSKDLCNDSSTSKANFVLLLLLTILAFFW